MFFQSDREIFKIYVKPSYLYPHNTEKNKPAILQPKKINMGQYFNTCILSVLFTKALRPNRNEDIII